MSKFVNYSDITYTAFKQHPKASEIVSRKEGIIKRALMTANFYPKSILFVGFTPALYSFSDVELWCTDVSETVYSGLLESNIAVSKLTANSDKKYDLVVAADEYFTYADTDTEQIERIKRLCELSNGLILTTLRDYKNLDFKAREYSEPALIRTIDGLVAYTEIHDWANTERGAWYSSVYSLEPEKPEYHGTFNRRTMYFKQLAKFSADFGYTNFMVHKNLMYKSLIRKNYEHVITISKI